MNEPSQKKDFSQKTGMLMTTIAWIAFILFIAYFFERLIDNRNNPNQNVYSENINGSVRVSLQRNPQGHYISDGRINDQLVVFLLDTGATEVAIPMRVANQLNLNIGRSIQVKTANGTAIAYRTRLQSISLGDIILYDFPATILNNIAGDEILLGMSFLKNFELIQKGKTLTIKQ